MDAFLGRIFGFKLYVSPNNMKNPLVDCLVFRLSDRNDYNEESPHHDHFNQVLDYV